MTIRPLGIMKVNTTCGILETLNKWKILIPGIQWFLLNLELEHHWITYPRYLTAIVCKLNETLKALIQAYYNAIWLQA